MRLIRKARRDAVCRGDVVRGLTQAFREACCDPRKGRVLEAICSEVLRTTNMLLYDLSQKSVLPGLLEALQHSGSLVSGNFRTSWRNWESNSR